jgi:hypothetical protein
MELQRVRNLPLSCLGNFTPHMRVAFCVPVLFEAGALHCAGALLVPARPAGLASRADAADIAEPFEVAFTVQLNADEAGEVVFKVYR